MAPDFTSLSDTAQRISQERQASLPTVIKELLHYEILLALMESGSASDLVFQGGTALRLCYGGVRYSEDLDFAGGLAFEPCVMTPFVERMKETLANRYDLAIEVEERLPNLADKVPVGGWKARIRLPQVERSARNSYFINIEVAKVPAYSSEILPLRTLSGSAPYAYRSVLLKAESKEEILADKIIALGARPYIKYRDVWDLHMLAQEGVLINNDLVHRKVKDYGLESTHFIHDLETRIAHLSDSAAERAFQKEMLRFLEGPHQVLIGDGRNVHQMLTVAARVGEKALDLFASTDPSLPGGLDAKHDAIRQPSRSQGHRP